MAYRFICKNCGEVFKSDRQSNYCYACYLERKRNEHEPQTAYRAAGYETNQGWINAISAEANAAKTTYGKYTEMLRVKNGQSENK